MKTLMIYLPTGESRFFEEGKTYHNQTEVPCPYDGLKVKGISDSGYSYVRVDFEFGSWVSFGDMQYELIHIKKDDDFSC